MNEFIKVDVVSYVRKGLEDGTLIPREAVKFARIIAERGVEGQEVISWSSDKEGNEIKEKVAKVTLDEKTKNPGWIATKADKDGYPVYDSNNHLNQWIIDDTTFMKKYEIDPENPSLFKPKGGPQIFVQIYENIILEQWGSEITIAAGGFINITNPEDIYGISEKDFFDTYRFTDERKAKIRIR